MTLGRGLLVLPLLLLALAVHAGPDGDELFGLHCAVCHGAEGMGGVGVPLALPGFLASVDDDYLSRTIRLGRPGRVMPAFGSRLAEEEIAAIVATVRGWGPAEPTLSTQPVSGDVARGAVLFGERCAACHGDKGQGGHGTGVTFSRPRDLPIIAPAINNPGFLASASDPMIKRTLMEGREGTPMVSFIKQGLSEAEIDDVVAFVRSFENNPLPRDKAEGEPGVISLESSYGLEETVENVIRAVKGKNFRLIRKQYLEEGLVPAGEENRQQVMIYFCNFNFLYDALAIDPRVGLFLPCRITVLERDGVVTVSSINPRPLGRMFNNKELDRACDEMYKLYTEIIEEATL